jgi:hypothetical protein
MYDDYVHIYMLMRSQQSGNMYVFNERYLLL